MWAAMGELIAWAAVAFAALLTFVGVCALTRPLRLGFPKAWLRALSLALMLTPAPVPGVSGYFAPAYMVALFEVLFQIDGQPAQSLKLLAAACLAATALAWLWSWFRRRPRRALD